MWVEPQHAGTWLAPSSTARTEGLLAAPARLSRASKRWFRMTLFTMDTMAWCAQVKKEAGADRPVQAAERLTYVSQNLCAMHGVRVRIHGTLPEGPVIWVANHLSYLDPIVLASVARVAPIAKAEVKGWPLIGPSLDGLGVLQVDRTCGMSGARVLREAASRLSQGVSVLAFPEGTTSFGTHVLPFRRGIFGLARRYAVPIVPVHLRYSDPTLCWVGDASFLPHYMRTTRARHIDAHVTMGPPTAAGAGESATEYATRVRETISALAQRGRYPTTREEAA